MFQRKIVKNRFWLFAYFSLFCIMVVVPTVGHADSKTLLTRIKFFPLPDKRVQLNLAFNRPVRNLPTSFFTETPPRIVFDFANVGTHLAPAARRRLIDVGILHQYSVASTQDRTRLVLALNQVASFSTKRHGNTLSIVLKRKPLAARTAVKQHFAQLRNSHNQHYISGVKFHGTKLHGGQIIIKLSDPNIGVDLRKQGNKVLVDFMNTGIPRRFIHNYNVVDFHTPVRSFQVRPSGRQAHLEILTSGNYEHFAYQTNNEFIVEIHPISKKRKQRNEQAVYSGKRISLNFQDIKVRAVLQLLAEFTGKNIVVSDSVKGHITLRLNHVPWDQALDIILKTRGLAKRQLGSVMLVAPSAEIANQEKQELQEQKDVSELAPTHAELIQVNYAKAATLAAMLKDKTTSLLSARGNISVDERTNTLWVQDTADKLQEVRNLVHKLDKPVRQVLIEARIVSVKRDFEKDLGIRFGFTNPRHVSGSFIGTDAKNPSGANQIAGGTSPALVTDPLSRLNVDLPAAIASVKQTPSFGIALAKLGNDVFLDLELSAIESEGKGEVISSPRLVTANQHEALIESGEEIPYQEATSSGAAAIAFKEAVLRLRVTPQITPDHKIIMTLQVNQDSVSPQTVLGVPIILTKKIETNVLVDNGQTIVLGGIFLQNKSKSVDRVPFLGELPFVGALFRNTNHTNKQEELLIFITPKIMHAYG